MASQAPTSVAERYSSLSEPLVSGSPTHSNPDVTAVMLEPVSAPLVGFTLSSDQSMRTFEDRRSWSRSPIAASAFRPANASRTRYSENAERLLLPSADTPNTVLLRACTSFSA